MKKNLKLSVAVITYNQEKYISKTLNEILNQKTEFSYNIVIGEDSSKDFTAQICDDFQKKNADTITVIHNEKNLGVTKNFYNVIKNCTGEYLMVCAGDDYWLQDKIQFQIDFMENNAEIDFIYGKVIGINHNDEKINFSWGKQLNNFNDIFSNEAAIPPVTMCVRKSVMDEYLNDVNPESSNWKMEDYPFYLWIFKNKKTAFIDKYFAAYRVLENSISHSSDAQKEIQFHKYVKDVRESYIEKYALGSSYSFKAQEIFVRNKMGIAVSHRNKKIFEEAFRELKKKTFKDYIKYFLIKMNIYIFFKEKP